MEGCATIAKSDGLCPKHYARRWRHGDTGAAEYRADPWERFAAFVDVGASGLSCWQWTGEIDRNGYGRCTPHLGTRWAHRWVYALLTGGIPEGMTLDHLCRNTSCVNPDHLEPVSRQVNLERAYDVQWLGTCSRNLHDLTTARERRADGRRECSACAAAR